MRILTRVVVFAIAFVIPSAAFADAVPLGDDAFTAYMQKRLQLYSAAPITIAGPFKVSVNLPSGASVSFGFSDVHDACVKQPANCEHLADVFVQDMTNEVLARTNTAPGLPVTANAAAAGPVDTTRLRILLRIMATCQTVASVGSQMFCKIVPSADPHAYFFRRAFANLEAFCIKTAGDNSRAVMTNADRRGLDLSVNEALDLCEKDTRDALGPFAGKVVAPPAGGIGSLEGPYAASLAIFAADWTSVAKSFGGRLLIAVPARDTLLYMADDGPDAVKTLGARAQAEFELAGAPVCSDVYRWDGDGFVLATSDSTMPRGPMQSQDLVQELH